MPRLLHVQVASTHLDGVFGHQGQTLGLISAMEASLRAIRSQEPMVRIVMQMLTTIGWQEEVGYSTQLGAQLPISRFQRMLSYNPLSQFTFTFIIHIHIRGIHLI
jgi:hypothetical protein